MRDFYELNKKGTGFSDPCVIDECSLLSIINMSKTRNKSLHKKLVAWYLKVNSTGIKDNYKHPKTGFGLSIPDIIDDIGDLT